MDFIGETKDSKVFNMDIKSGSKKGPTFKNWTFVKDPHFLFNPHETLRKSLSHMVIIFTKFHEDMTKNVDFLLLAKVYMGLVFLIQTLEV